MKNVSFYIPMVVTDHTVTFWVMKPAIWRNTLLCLQGCKNRVQADCEVIMVRRQYGYVGFRECGQSEPQEEQK
jgi:hypothetical protein